VLTLHSVVIYGKQLFILNVCSQAAKETGALQAAKNKLEKQVEELTWRLQLEKRMRVIIFFTRSIQNILILAVIMTNNWRIWIQVFGFALIFFPCSMLWLPFSILSVNGFNLM
jgi:hypothetical protein